ncbi:hypothetical protein [Phaffia rhodozyma]|uniref:Uncharacterized protein n=1 Tax=Phaffia rhodozyma TaxID=264483 RepID=A0A0F7SP89_PHARH|nr:hypothetical protein [Phaffia rhodozyma]
MEGRLHTLQRSTCSCHQRQPFSAMVTVDSSELQKKEELRASKTLGIPCEGRRVDGTLWSGNDKDYKPCPQETHELALSPERQNDTRYRTEDRHPLHLRIKKRVKTYINRTHRISPRECYFAESRDDTSRFNFEPLLLRRNPSRLTSFLVGLILVDSKGY